MSWLVGRKEQEGAIESLLGAVVVFAWLLLVPAGDGGVNAPLKTWFKAGSYATQEACEYEKKIHLAGAHNMVVNPGESARHEQKAIVITESSLCISDDDRRLQ